MRRFTAYLALLTLSSFAQSTWAADPIVAGKQYRGGSELTLEAAGAQFRVPKGWIGLLPVGGDALMLRSTTTAGMLQVFLTPGDVDPLAESMGSVVSVEDDINLIPVGDPQVGEDRIANTYYVTNTDYASKGYAVGLPQAGSYGVGIIGIGPMDKLTDIRLAVETVATSVTFSQP